MKNINNSQKNNLLDMLCQQSDIYRNFDENFFTSNIFACVCDYENNCNIISTTTNFNNFIYSLHTTANNLTLKQLLPNDEFTYFQSLIKRALKNKTKSIFTDLHFNNKNSSSDSYLCCCNFTSNKDKKTLIELTLMSLDKLDLNQEDTLKCKHILELDNFVILEGEITNKLIFNSSYISDNISFYGLNNDDILNNGMDFKNLIYKDDFDLVIAQAKKCADKKQGFTHTLRIINQKGQMFWIVAKGIITTSGKSNKKLYLFFHSIETQAKYIQQFSQKEKKLSENLKQSNLITDILKLLQVAQDYEDSIRIILKKLTAYANLSSSIFYIPDTSSTKENVIVYSYKKSGNNFTKTRTSYSELTSTYPAITQRLKSYGTAYCDKFSSSEGCSDEFSKHGLTSCLIYTIYLSNMQDAYLCCIDKNPNRCWNNKLVSVISDISQIFTGMIHGFLISHELSNAKNTLTKVLDNIDAYVFVSELGTDKIIYSNKKFVDTFGNDAVGKHFWEVVQIEITQCVKKNRIECVTENGITNDEIKPRYYEIYCPVSDQWLDITEINIKWHDGNIVKLSTMNDITQKINYEKLIENQAYTDHLTNLPNRRMLEHDFPIILAEAEKAESFGYILFLDLDNFKNVNDGLGHPYGDALLIKISQFLLSMQYISNSCYRFGGDEFIILINYKNADRIDNIINTLLNKFQQKWEIINTEYYCTASIGVAKFPYDGYTLFDLMKKVDMAMYSSKKLGKNRFTYYKSKIGSESIRNIELERYFRESVNNNCAGFEVYYQPIINATTQKIEGAEALLRWSSDDIGRISPSEFIPLTESIGLIVPLGDFVLTEALIKCKEIISMGYPDFKMFINLSVLQLIENDIVDRIKNIIDTVGVPFKNIGLEVTEGLAINDMDKMKEVLDKLSSLGIKISLDDFGTGYSSLNYIKQLPLNTIKIDKSFIDDLDTNNGTELFVCAIVDIAHGLNMKVCAEGVETQSQYDKLLRLKADVIQGYYFGRPMPSDEFTQKYKKNNDTMKTEAYK